MENRKKLIQMIDKYVGEEFYTTEQIADKIRSAIELDEGKIKKIISDSKLSEIAWQYIDSSGELTTEGGVKKVNRLGNKVAKAIANAKDIVKIR